MNAPDSIVVLRAGWMAVGAFHLDKADECRDCGHCEQHSQHVPYGEGSAEQSWTECMLGSRPYHKFTDCPAWQAVQLKEEEEMSDAAAMDGRAA